MANGTHIHESRRNEIVFLRCPSPLHVMDVLVFVFTARCYAERGIATASRPSVRDVEAS